MVIGNGLTLQHNFFEHVFCFACLCWALASGHCVALAVKTSTVQVAIGNGIGRMCLLRGHYLLCVLDFICEPMLGHIASGFAAAQWKPQVPAMPRMRWKTRPGAIGPQAPICQCSRMKGWLRSASVSMARSGCPSRPLSVQWQRPISWVCAEPGQGPKRQ